MQINLHMCIFFCTFAPKFVVHIHVRRTYVTYMRA